MKRQRAFYGETLPNPYLRVFPIKEVSDIGRKIQYPINYGQYGVTCNMQTNRAWGCSSGIFINQIYWRTWNYCAGALIDSGNFDWTADPKRQPLFNEPDNS